MKVVAAAAAGAPGPSCASRGLGRADQAAAAAAAASLLLDMKGCYSRLAALVPTLPRHRRVSKVEILQHVIDYIWDLQLELQDPPRDGEEAAGGAEPACDRILCR
ncbi:DNA-binding protein inhibitor ID-1-like [Erythrolamprus reginae]|uniref:DNA-binding protein inhibitor ID-1-like n=1 Tax=Erythrolamprus reginae TaxID=121349 RepID=UPI00396CD155